MKNKENKFKKKKKEICYQSEAKVKDSHFFVFLFFY